MKIVLNSMDEVIDFVRGLHPGLLAMAGHGAKPDAVEQLARQVDKANPTVLRDMDDIHFGKLQTAPSKTTAEFPPGVTSYPTNTADEPNGLPQDIQSPIGPTDTVNTVQVADPVDASGRRWDERIDSSSKETTGKGLWRARRNVPDDVRAAVLAELSAQPEPDRSEDAEPLVTETHALPNPEADREFDQASEPEAETGAETEVETQPAPSEPAAPRNAIDYAALIAASQEAALDASDSHTDLLTACQGFIGAYGHAAYGELRKHVAPKDETGGKAIQEFTPAERRLMQACIVNYPR